MTTCPVMPSHPIPLHLQQSSPSQEANLCSYDDMFLSKLSLRLRRACFSSSVQPKVRFAHEQSCGNLKRGERKIKTIMVKPTFNYLSILGKGIRKEGNSILVERIRNWMELIRNYVVVEQSKSASQLMVMKGTKRSNHVKETDKV